MFKLEKDQLSYHEAQKGSATKSSSGRASKEAPALPEMVQKGSIPISVGKTVVTVRDSSRFRVTMSLILI